MKIKDYWPLILPIITILIATIMGVNSVIHKETPYLVGMIEAEYTDVASEIPGRVIDVYVEKGDTVTAGKLLVKLKSDGVNALTIQAKAGVTAATAQQKLIDSGARKSTINSARNFYLTTKESYNLAVKNYKRAETLFNDSVISEVELEAYRFKMNSSKRAMESAKADYESAKQGARDESKVIAKAGVEQAKGALELAQTIENSVSITAPISGIVVNSIVSKGEVANTGYPLLTIMDPHSYHAILHIRQDKMLPYKDGVTLKAYIPGVSKNKSDLFDFVIRYSAPMLDFADWIPTNQKGDFDLKTYEIHLRPVKEIEGLKPGMTIGFIAK